MRKILSCFLVASILIYQLLAVAHSVAAQSAPAESLRDALFQAQFALTTDPKAAQQALELATSLYAGQLAPTLAIAAPAADQRAQRGLSDAAAALRSGDAAAFAAARALVWTAVLDGSYQTTIQAINRGDAATARSWLAVREYRHATRFSRPGADATLALADFAAGSLEAASAVTAVDADLLDTYQTLLSAALDDLNTAQAQGLASRRVESAALAQGYFELLKPAYSRQRGETAAAAAQNAFAGLLAAAMAAQDLTSLQASVATDLLGFRAAPLGHAEQVRRAGQMFRFLTLVPIEYDRGVSDGRVTVDLEIREAISFRDAAEAAFTDLRPLVEASHPEGIAAAATLFDALQANLAEASAHEKVTGPDAIRGTTQQLLVTLRDVVPSEWTVKDGNADFDVIAATLDQMEKAVAAGDYVTAESARLEAYAILESGPEAKLVAFAPQHVAPIEELFWYGQGDHTGLAFLIGHNATREQIAASRAALDERLSSAQKTLTGASSPVAVATNAAIIVFREGLEAVLILAALVASLVGGNRVYRRPMVLGVSLACLATLVTWWLAQRVLTTFSRYGERLEAVVSLVAIAVLLLITNWFFHRFYWKDWMAGFHARKKVLLGAAVSGQMLGFVLLGFSSVYREGFETVLFLQALVLESGVWSVLQGVALGLLGVAVLGYVTFRLQSRLPYKRMLVVTGMMIGAVLLVMVGNTVHVLQLVGWLPVHPIRSLNLPYWLGMWFGTFATWEGVGLQIVAAAFVIGSYYVAEHQQPRQKKTSRQSQSSAAATAVARQHPPN